MDMKNKMELIHIECGKDNAIAIYKIADMVIKFSIGDSKYDMDIGYGFETNVNHSDGIISYELDTYDESYIAHMKLPNNVPTIIKLNKRQLDWWLHNGCTNFCCNDICCGADDGGIIYVSCSEFNWFPYDEWLKLEHHPYEHVIIQVLYEFSMYFNTK